MILKLNGQYLDFNADIDIEKKVKLFEEIESADGDVSYEFEIPLTSENLAILGPIMPDASDKSVYSENDCEVLNDEGSLINRGSLRVERVNDLFASCSFLGGNSNWFALISGNLTELRLSQYDVELTQTNITNSWDQTEGLVFPFVDIGTVASRSYQNTVTEDFTGSFYLHTLFREVFKQSGIKIQGELLEDWLFLNTTVITDGRSLDEIQNRAVYISRTTETNITGGSYTKITFDDDSTTPYFDGSDLFDLVNSKFVADIKMTVRINLSLNTTEGLAKTYIAIYKNGVAVYVKLVDITGVMSPKTLSYNAQLEAGDYIEIYARNTATGYAGAGTLRITPLFLYTITGSGAVPRWTKQQLVSNVFSLFNVVPVYDSINKTLTLNLFDKIKEKEAVDISDYIQVNEIDYSEFISNYAKVNNFAYSEGSDEDLRQYNIDSFIKYGAGTIQAENDFIDNYADVVELDFASPISYVNEIFNTSMERVNFLEYTEDDAQSFGSVTDSSGVPRFNITDADEFYEENNIVRIETDTGEYDGEYVVTSVTSTYVQVRGLSFGASVAGTMIRLFHTVVNDDSAYLLVKIKKDSINDISGQSAWYLNQGAISLFSLSYFNLLRLGNNIEEIYKQSLCFGNVSNAFSFQKNILEKYWVQFGRILNDPAMLKVTAHLPLTVYNRLDFLHPVTIRSKQTSNLYYVNRISGYKNSYTPCELELIKLP